MDKQKQILSNHEEISELANALYGMQGEFDMSNPYEVGYVLINKLGYRKIPEGAVVLTREEYEKLIALKEDYVKGYEAGVDEGWENGSEKTAEKFAERLKEYFNFQYEFPCWQMKKRTIDKIDEICKEFTEG